MRKIAWVTSERVQQFDASDEGSLIIRDDMHAVRALEADGWHVEATVWSDNKINWQSYDVVLIRTPWDYIDRSEAFFVWFERINSLGVKVLNPLSVVRDNYNKRYLRTLAEKGASVIETKYVKKGQKRTLKQMSEALMTDEIVIKPVISCGSYHTYKLSGGDEINAFEKKFLDLLEQDDEFMVQKFYKEIAAGEWSLVFFNKQFSHSVRKVPKPGEFRSLKDFGGTVEKKTAPKHVVDQARGVLELVDQDLLYARVDGVLSGDIFKVMELELIEPELFLRADKDAPQNFVDALKSYF